MKKTIRVIKSGRERATGDERAVCPWMVDMPPMAARDLDRVTAGNYRRGQPVCPWLVDYPP